jgi:hypothetical protein
MTAAVLAQDAQLAPAAGSSWGRGATTTLICPKMMIRSADFKVFKDSTCPLAARSVGNRSLAEAPKKP